MQSLTLRAVIHDLASREGSRVIDVVARDAWEHHLRFEDGAVLVLGLHPEHNTVYLTAAAGGRDASPSPLTRSLARTLVGSRFVDAAQAGLDRVAALRFRGRDRLGDPVAYQVVLELTGNGANLALVEGDAPWSGKIVDRLRDQRSRAHPRRLNPGSRYAPPASGKVDAAAADDAVLAAALRATGSPPTKQRLIEAWEGMSPESAREILAGGGELTETEAAARWREFTAATAPGDPPGNRYAPAVVESAGSIEVLCFVPEATTAGPPAQVTRCGTVFAALEEAHRRFRAAGRETRQSSLAVNLKVARRRAEKALGALDREENDDRDPRRLRQLGETLLAAAHEFPKGATAAALTLPDTGEAVTVRLNPALSAAENAELYFRKARKADRAGSAIDDRRRELEQTVDALEDLAARLAGFGDGEPDAAWLGDAKRLGVALPKEHADKVRDTAPGRELPGSLQPRRYDLGQGWEVLVGRSDQGNHVLTFELSRPEDIWMHAEGCPGSHVVLRHDERGKEPPRAVLLTAAGIAAFHSKARGATKVPVTVASRRHVRRPRKAPVGQALVGEHKTVMVAPVDPDARRNR